MIELSVVIPTHNRAEGLRRNLLALTRQTAAPDVYEIVVVADGCTDETVAMVAAMAPGLRCRLSAVAQASSGAAAARNLGALSAAGAILLFLDDDMEAAPGLVAAHIAAHRDRPRAVVVGRFWTPSDATAGLLSHEARRWWADCAAARSRPDHRFTFMDVCAGNLSLTKELFEHVGGFDASIGADMSGEDFDLGIRLIRADTHFAYAAEAACVHHDCPTRQRALRRAEQEGRGHTLLAQRHPALFWRFPLGRIGRTNEWQLLEALLMLLWSWPGLFRPVAAGLVWAAVMAEALGQTWIARRLHGGVRRYHYFVGARSIISSRTAWRRMQQEAPLEPSDVREIEVDLAGHFDRLDRVLADARPDAVRVSHRDTPILRIDPVFGAESIRGVHVRRELLRRAPGLVLGLLLENRGERSAAR